VHTLDLPAKNMTRDRDINQISLFEQGVVVTRDADFFYSHLLQQRPWKLLLVKTGNISTRDLCDLFERNLPAIEAALQSNTLVEIDRVSVSPAG
jgi:predicted nuclease of predicted toxin-antitoxin system